MAATRAAGTTGAHGNGGVGGIGVAGGGDYPADGTTDGGLGTGESAGPAAGAQPRSRRRALGARGRFDWDTVSRRFAAMEAISTRLA